MSEVRHNCGFCVAHTLYDAYSLIKSLQHRGREATGIAAIGDRIDVIKWKGPVSRFELTDLHKILPGTDYHTFMAHVRYATRGRKDLVLEDAHPHTIGGKVYSKGDHIIVLDCEIAGVHNGQVDEEYFKDIDKGLLKTGCDTEAFIHLFWEKGEHEILKQISGAYTIAIADKRRKEVIVLRDRTGIKPGVLGWKDGKFCIASEDIAFKRNGGEFIEDLNPGSAYYLDSNGSYREEKIVDKQLAHCFFEWNYIANVNSILNGISVRNVRESLGEMLAEEFPNVNADLVSFLPRCPEVAARSYAKKLGLPFEPIFYKMRGERAFLGSTTEDREDSINVNLHILPQMEEILKGKTSVIVDDSTIRGNNSRRARKLVYEEAGVKEAFLFNYTPRIGIIGEDGIGRGCKFGVDIPSDDNFIVRERILGENNDIKERNRTLEEISNEVGMHTHFLSLAGMLKVYGKLGMPEEHLCTYCIGGKYPFKEKI